MVVINNVNGNRSSQSIFRRRQVARNYKPGVLAGDTRLITEMAAAAGVEAGLCRGGKASWTNG